MTLKWILVLPIALLCAFVVDVVLSLLFNVIIFVGSLVHLSPLAEFFFSPPVGYWLIIFVSNGIAVLSGVYVAPSHKVLVAAMISFLVISLRLAMTISIMTGNNSFTEDTPGEYVLGTISAFLGLLFSFIFVFRKFKRSNLIEE